MARHVSIRRVDFMITTKNLSIVTSTSDSTTIMSPMDLIMNSGAHNLASHCSRWHSVESPYVTVSETVTMTMCVPIKMFPKSKFMTKMQRGERRTWLLQSNVTKTRRFEATASNPNVHNASFTPVLSPIIPGQHVLFPNDSEATQMTFCLLSLFSQLARTQECLGKGECFFRSSLMSIASEHIGWELPKHCSRGFL